jgi:Rps23 Pro-64 3,4-dihydroxylase Tpa1-like proline 4-hydroxylase
MKKITKYKSFFTDEFFNEIQDYVNNILKTKSSLFATSLSWDQNLVKTSSLIARYELLQDDIEIYTKIKKEIEKNISYYVSTCTIHVLPHSSYITWHNDSHHDAALTIYLNDNWNENWGGFLMYEDDDIIKAIKPEKNLAVLQENHVNHCVTTVNIGANYRISLQLFLDKKKSIL